MKIDLYTKAVLSIIAVALVWIGIQLTPAASAGPEVVQVDLLKIDGRVIGRTPLPVEIVKK